MIISGPWRGISKTVRQQRLNERIYFCCFHLVSFIQIGAVNKPTQVPPDCILFYKEQRHFSTPVCEAQSCTLRDVMVFLRKAQLYRKFHPDAFPVFAATYACVLCTRSVFSMQSIRRPAQHSLGPWERIARWPRPDLSRLFLAETFARNT